VSEHDIEASDWTEQDLLTRELALERLAQDETETEAELARLRSADGADRHAIELLEKRLRALEATRSNLAIGT
jgi:hypothetical protein